MLDREKKRMAFKSDVSKVKGKTRNLSLQSTAWVYKPLLQSIARKTSDGQSII